MKFLLFMLISFNVFAEQLPITSRGIDHVGITVPNAKEAMTFFSETFGCKELSMIGPYTLPYSMSNDRKSQVASRAKSMSLWMLDCGPGATIEVFEYENSKGKKAWPDHEDFGGHHIAFYTENIQEAVKYLKQKGVTIIGEPLTMTAGPTAGETWVHFMAPWGLEMELVESPNGKAFQKQADSMENVIHNHFQAINELNTKKREDFFQKSYSKQVNFVDPFFQVTGHDHLEKMYDELHKKYPEHHFVVIGKPKFLHESARVSWNLVDKHGETIHSGEDFLLFRNGLISNVYVYINK